MTMRRSGQKSERATAVEPPTLPVPPNIRILEFFTLSGRSTLSILLVLLGLTLSPAEAMARFGATPAFNCKQNIAMFCVSDVLFFFFFFPPHFISLSLLMMWASRYHQTLPTVLWERVFFFFSFLFFFLFGLFLLKPQAKSLVTTKPPFSSPIDYWWVPDLNLTPTRNQSILELKFTLWLL